MRKIRHFFSNIEDALNGAIEIRWVYSKEGIYISHRIHFENDGRFNVEFIIY